MDCLSSVSGQCVDRSTSIKKSYDLFYSKENRDELWDKKSGILRVEIRRFYMSERISVNEI